MNLITVFSDHDGLLEDFDDEGGTSAVIKGNRMTIYGDDRVIARAELTLDHNVPVWILKRGQRGKEIGRAIKVRFAV